MLCLVTLYALKLGCSLIAKPGYTRLSWSGHKATTNCRVSAVLSPPLFFCRYSTKMGFWTRR